MQLPASLVMPRFSCALRVFSGLLLLLFAASACSQQRAEVSVKLTVVDETDQPVAAAQVTIAEPSIEPAHLRTDYAGTCDYTLHQPNPYRIHVERPGFYQADADGVEAARSSVMVVLAHEQIVHEQVNVTASAPGIDVEQVSDRDTLNTPEIVNIPYPTSRDIRNLLPYSPGVVSDAAGQLHVAGSETSETLDTIDGFDVRSPAGGGLNMRVSTDAVRSITTETTRYPAEYGRSTGGVIAFVTGMGDNKFRFNATNFIPSFRSANGIRLDKLVPRFTFSGPLKKGRAWWYEGAEIEYDNIYIAELPAGANSNQMVRGSNLLKAQANLSQKNILSAGLLFNDSHSPYDGISSLTPRQSTVKRDILAWLPYLRNQWSFVGGALLDAGVAAMRFRDGHESRGDAPYQITPETTQGSFFENLAARSQCLEGNAALYLPPRNWRGRHDLKAGLDLDHVAYRQNQSRASVSYLREDNTLLRQSVFASVPAFALHNAEIGAYFQDRWQPAKGWLAESGMRFDWDEIVRRPLFSPRLAAVYSPGGNGATKISAGIGLYYEHTQLEHLAQSFAGIRFDTYYAADGITATGPPSQTVYTMNRGSLRAPSALNWSVGVERKLPWSIDAGANYLDKRTSNLLAFANPGGAAALAGDYLLTNARLDRYRAEEFSARRLFANGYTVYISYTHSSARTNTALDYLPTPSPLGAQQGGPLPWETPNRVISWGWLPVPLPKFKNHWDFVYAFDRRTGYPFTALDAAQQVAGAVGSRRFPVYVNFSPGLEWRFHLRGQYWGLRGVMENATDSGNPAMVNNVMDSPRFRTFSQFQGRAFTARIRLIGAK